MNLQDALNQLPKPVGATTLIAAVMSGDFSSISTKQANDKNALQEAEESLEKAQESQNNCKSDWAYWGYMGEISYWRSVINLLKAAEVAGPESRPDIPYPNRAVVVMDHCAEIEQWSGAVLEAAKKKAA